MEITFQRPKHCRDILFSVVKRLSDTWFGFFLIKSGCFRAIFRVECLIVKSSEAGESSPYFARPWVFNSSQSCMFATTYVKKFSFLYHKNQILRLVILKNSGQEAGDEKLISYCFAILRRRCYAAPVKQQEEINFSNQICSKSCWKAGRVRHFVFWHWTF